MKLDRPLQNQRRSEQRPPKKKKQAAATNSTARSNAVSRQGRHRGKLGRSPSIPHTAGSQDESRCSAIHKQRPYRVGSGAANLKSTATEPEIGRATKTSEHGQDWSRHDARDVQRRRKE